MYNENGICWNVTKWVTVIWLGTRAVTGNFQTFFMKVNERLWSWVHTAHHDYFSFVTHTGITILLFQSREPTQRITITILLLPTQGITIFLFQSREPTQWITITYLLLATQGITIVLFHSRGPIQRLTILFFCYPHKA